jgi:hypothetical protein
LRRKAPRFLTRASSDFKTYRLKWRKTADE